MNQKDFAELRRRFRPEKSDLVRIRGCYVNEKREIISEFAQTIGTLSLMESEDVLSIIRKTLSGAIGKHLIDVAFTNEQVMGSDEHGLLMAVRKSALEDDAAVHALFTRVKDSVSIEGNLLILLAYDNYSVPAYHRDGARAEDSVDEFPFFVCSVCPVKTGKPPLSYSPQANRFFNLAADNLIGAPEVGFLFPAFDDRSANIYNAAYYTRSTSESQSQLVDTLFHTRLPMPAAAQKEAFDAILEDTIREDCSIEVMQAVHDQLTLLIAEHRESREPEPLTVTRQTVETVLAAAGVAGEHVQAFCERFDGAFGEDAALCPENIVDARQFAVTAPDVTIRVSPERSDLVETRLIDGRKYILIRADDGVEVNGVSIRIH